MGRVNIAFQSVTLLNTHFRNRSPTRCSTLQSSTTKFLRCLQLHLNGWLQAIWPRWMKVASVLPMIKQKEKTLWKFDPMNHILESWNTRLQIAELPKISWISAKKRYLFWMSWVLLVHSATILENMNKNNEVVRKYDGLDAFGLMRCIHTQFATFFSSPSPGNYYIWSSQIGSGFCIISTFRCPEFRKLKCCKWDHISADAFIRGE